MTEETGAVGWEVNEGKRLDATNLVALVHGRKLEAEALAGGEEDALLVSMVVSLKRIADAVEKLAGCVSDSDGEPSSLGLNAFAWLQGPQK